MNVLLYIPALLFVVFKSRGLLHVCIHVALIVVTQAALGYPFLAVDTGAYLASAFDLSREFMYKWTVNWRFLPEAVFLDRRFGSALLVGHLTCLVSFAVFLWSKPYGLFGSLSHVLSGRSFTVGLGPVSTDGKFFFAGMLACTTLTAHHRAHHSILYLKSHWGPFFSITSLSILLVVCIPDPVPPMANKIPSASQVRALGHTPHQ